MDEGQEQIVAADEPTFTKGQKVVHKGSGPVMVVNHVEEDGTVVCQWWSHMPDAGSYPIRTIRTRPHLIEAYVPCYPALNAGRL